MGSTKKEGPDLKKLETLLAQFQIEHDRQGELIREMVTLLGGGAGIGKEMARAAQIFDEMWKSRYHSAYVWTHVKDKPQLKRLIGSLGIVELERRITRYLTSADPFLLQRRHPFGLLVTTINSYADAAPAGDFVLEAPAPLECGHQPPCTSDQEHTARRARELRTVSE